MSVVSRVKPSLSVVLTFVTFWNKYAWLSWYILLLLLLLSFIQPFRYIRKWIVRFTLSRKKGECMHP